jgi:23S rRNA pseudouridine1911/1915/1917 synthase
MDQGQSVRELISQPSPSQTVQLVVTADDGAPRLDVFLAARLPTVARREIAGWITNGHVRLNGRPCTKGTRLRANDTISVSAVLSLRPNPRLPINILYEDHALLVLDKPVHIPSVALRHEETDTVANFLLAHFPETGKASPHSLEAGVVHRLDTLTSGILLAARTPYAYTALRQQFSAHTVMKHYLALIEGHLKKQGQISVPLEPIGSRGQRMRGVSSGRGQEAYTAYTPETILSKHTLLRINITTGVRHQIRAHLAVLGHPIVGDTLYGAIKTGTRLCLHAEALEFVHPTTGQHVRFTSPLPEDFRVEIERLQSAC